MQLTTEKDLASSERVGAFGLIAFLYQFFFSFLPPLGLFILPKQRDSGMRKAGTLRQKPARPVAFAPLLCQDQREDLRQVHPAQKSGTRLLLPTCFAE